MQILSGAYRVADMANRRTLTPEEKACADRAKSLWLAKMRRERLTQADAAAKLGFSVSAFSQYINGKIPLNTDTTAALAKYFGVSPRDINPGWLNNTAEPLDAEYLATIAVLSDDQILQAMESVAQKASPRAAMRLARLFLDRAEAGL